MLAATLVLASGMTQFPLIAFAAIGQPTANVRFRDPSFVETGRNDHFVVGGLKTKGGDFLVLLYTDGTESQKIRQIVVSSDETSSRPFGVSATGSCEWLKKKLTLAFGAPIQSEATGDPGTDLHRHIRWQEQKNSLVVSYSEVLGAPGIQTRCDVEAEVVE